MTTMYLLFKNVIAQWMEDRGPRLGAALAFYTVFSLSPLLILVIALTGFLLGQSVAQNAIINQIDQVVGHQTAQAVQLIIVSVRGLGSARLATAIGLVTLFIGATGALVELQDGLNGIWKVKSRSGFLMMLKRRMMSLGLAAGIAFLLLVSLVISAMLSALGAFIGSRIPPVRQALWHGLDLFLSWSFITALFAMIYKVLPEVTIRWKDVWMGAAVTSVLFTLGKFLVGFYIGKSALVSAYGAMGSLVVILIWVYYSAAILYLGAEFTKIYADQHASRMPAGPGGKPS